MKIKILEKRKDEIKFEINKVNPAFVNALRRVAIYEVPTLSIENVNFRVNNSALFDEIIAHRLGLIPLKFDPKTLNLPESCSCDGKGCINCQVVFVLEKAGPCTVYSGDLKNNLGDVKPLYDNMPIVKLAEEQRLVLDATAILGKGKNHVKWKSGIASYKYCPVIKIDLKKCDGCGKCLKVCPRDVFNKSGGKPKVTNENECMLCNSCVEACSKQAIEVKGDEKRFIFTLETISGLTPKQIITKACSILKGKTDELVKLL